ncbi:hypothetical protein ACFYKX_06040 [Cytobacillus sp. FJAT-54145]|uniref:Uncharacterized protein n=1 Tax=Cytobacillus spartinae TaxID=3299023 RepID=A0ABW6K7I2_9BACI
MRKVWMITVAFLLAIVIGGASASSASFVSPENDSKMNKNHHHRHHLMKEKAEELMNQGYTKEEIFMGAMLSKKSDKRIEDVLSLYKEKNKSWEETAKELGVDNEELEKIKSIQQWGKFVEENREDVIKQLAAYSNTKVEGIEAYIKDGYPLHFLIGAAAVGNLSNQSLEEILKYKKDGKSFHDIIKELNIDHMALRDEIEKFQNDVKKEVENKQD